MQHGRQPRRLRRHGNGNGNGTGTAAPARDGHRHRRDRDRHGTGTNANAQQPRPAHRRRRAEQRRRHRRDRRHRAGPAGPAGPATTTTGGGIITFSDRLLGAANRSATTDFAAPALDVPTFRRTFAGDGSTTTSSSSAGPRPPRPSSPARTPWSARPWILGHHQPDRRDRLGLPDHPGRRPRPELRRRIALRTRGRTTTPTGSTRSSPTPPSRPRTPTTTSPSPGRPTRWGRTASRSFARVDVGNAIAAIEGKEAIDYLLKHNTFNIIDANHDGLITAQETPELRGQRRHHRPGRGRVDGQAPGRHRPVGPEHLVHPRRRAARPARRPPAPVQLLRLLGPRPAPGLGLDRPVQAPRQVHPADAHRLHHHRPPAGLGQRVPDRPDGPAELQGPPAPPAEVRVRAQGPGHARTRGSPRPSSASTPTRRPRPASRRSTPSSRRPRTTAA